MRERLRSHPLDAFSLVAGILFVVLGVLVAIDASAGGDIDPRWTVAVLLVGLGLAGVLGTIDWSRRGTTDAGDQDDSDDPPNPPQLEKEWP